MIVNRKGGVCNWLINTSPRGFFYKPIRTYLLRMFGLGGFRYAQRVETCIGYYFVSYNHRIFFVNCNQLLINGINESFGKNIT